MNAFTQGVLVGLIAICAVALLNIDRHLAQQTSAYLCVEAMKVGVKVDPCKDITKGPTS